MLKKEYAFWMRGRECSSNHYITQEHVVYIGKEKQLNRYFDKKDTERVGIFATDYR
ncbi:hypothetical protein [Bacteroidetes bacterium endosymbiont of Geopemphigus sp.]|uniref:hypothetical protein n=1 Tax=Bacteroidetes bacterium endosymbiont of Geopemphigus sp. TaxID=2047937 RepID=UPI002243B93D|nr:hypothetical protein [Bacteroidetes bacterium endosymbiont of Geopemphigus sp.]